MMFKRTDGYYSGSLFSDREAQRLRDEGMAQAATSNRGLSWRLRADQWRESKPAGTRFTSDHLTFDVGVPDEEEHRGANRNNVVGATISAWANQSLIAPTGRFMNGKRVACHGAKLQEWRIL